MVAANLVEAMCLIRYLHPMEDMYCSESKFLGNEFINKLIQSKYVIKANPIVSGNAQSNSLLDIIYRIPGNYVWTLTCKKIMYMKMTLGKAYLMRPCLWSALCVI